MSRQTRNIITRESVRSKLQLENAAELRVHLLGTLICVLVFIPITLIAVRLFLLVSSRSSLTPVVIGLFWIVFTSPVWIRLILVKNLFAEKQMLRKDEFAITVRTLSYKQEELVWRHTEPFFYFTDFKSVSVPRATYQLGSSGDEFYLVHYRRKNKIKLLYSLKLYEYHEN